MTAASKEGRTASIVIIELADRLERRFLFNQNWPFCISAEKRCWPRWQNYWSPSKWAVKLGPAHSINMHCLPGGGPGVKYIQWLLTYSRKPYICVRWEGVPAETWVAKKAASVSSQIDNHTHPPNQPTDVQNIWQYESRHTPFIQLAHRLAERAERASLLVQVC